jgi:hypothetical protein
LYSYANFDLTFKDYVMFRPTGGIFIPIGIVDWWVRADAAKSAAWFVENSGEKSPPTWNDSIEFPWWDKVLLLNEGPE